MIRRLFQTIIFLFIFSTSIFASSAKLVSVGIAAEGTANALLTSTGYRTYTYYIPYIGYSLSLPVIYHINDKLAIEASPTYIDKPYMWLHVPSSYYRDTEIINNTFIELPLTVNLSLGKTEDIKFLTSFGFFVGYWLNSHVKGSIKSNTSSLEYNVIMQSFDEDLPFDSNRDNRFEAGLVTRVGAEFNIKDLMFFIRMNCLISLTDLSKRYQDYQTYKYNLTLGCQMGILYSFGGKQ